MRFALLHLPTINVTKSQAVLCIGLSCLGVIILVLCSLSKPSNHRSFKPTLQRFSQVPDIVPAPTQNRTKIILAWTRMYQFDIWFGFSSEEEYKSTLASSNCIFTRDASYLGTADLVVFHGCLQPHNSFTYPTSRHPHQRWVYVMDEAPTSRYCQNPFLPADNVFNTTATYKRSSDLSFAFSSLIRKRSTPVPHYDRTANKDRLVFWYLSDCSEWASKRAYYVLELQKYVQVDVFGEGSCNGLFPGTGTPCPKSSDRSMDTCFLQQSKKYKFYLSFENAFCADYITEKLFKVLLPESDVVPVALGASIKEYESMAPPNSFLHVSNFSSPAKLAEFLLYLDKNNDAYNAYHAWRTTYVMDPFPGRNSIDQHPASQLLQLCQYAHNPPPPRVWNNLVDWFSIEKNCRIVTDVCRDYGICK